MQDVAGHVEVLIFTAENPISADEIAEVLRQSLQVECSASEIANICSELIEDLKSSSRPYEIRLINGGYVLLSKPAFYQTIQTLNSHRAKRKLSQAALETLAIIAYRQPITKLEIENIRGVNCDYTLQKLLEKELINISGKAESVGKPLLYATSAAFMDHFGLSSVADLPQLKDLVQEDNSVGEPSSDKKD